MKKRRVYSGRVHHICQQSIGGAVVFYTLSDYLVYFTIYCTVARRYGIPVLAVCPMADHTHNTVIAPDSVTLSKLGNKQVKTALNYNYNNPVERKMVEKAEDYRWNFLRYAREKNPYSAPAGKKTVSPRFRGITREIQRIFLGNGYLHYAQLDRWRKLLDEKSFQQLVDYAISLWNIIDYEELIHYYGSYETLLRSLHDNTGSEYDIKEERDPYSDDVYNECSKILLKEGVVTNLFEIPVLPENIKEEAMDVLRRRTSARPRQIEKFLHMTPLRSAR